MSKKYYNKKIYDFMTLSANDSEGDLWIYGDIVDDKWYDDEVTPVEIRNSLNEMGTVRTLNLRINSYGGSCFAGNTIVNLIDDYKRKNGSKVVAYIDGIAASMGSGIAMAADKIYMAENAIFMVHKPYSVAIGNSYDMQHEAEILEKVEDTLVSNYMRHFNGTEEDMRQLMADESWLTAKEAKDYGFCDEIVPAVSVAASAKGVCINGHDFHEKELKERFKETEVEPMKNTEFEYDDSLMDYGIDEEKFKKFNVDSDTIKEIVSFVTTSKLDSVDEFISEDKANEFFGKEITSDDILNFAKIGMEVDNSASEKAKAYDKLVSTAIDDALKSGFKAKGESFNESKWKKILNSLDYDEIIDQKNEWEADAKIALKAGKRVSKVSDNGKPDSSYVNPDDYKFC